MLSLLLASLLMTAPPSPLAVTGGWARATPPAAENGAGYLTITNSGAAADRLVSIETKASKRAEIHTMSMKDGKMTMRALSEGVEVPAGGAVTLAPRGVHVMFLGLTAPLVAGARVPVTLQFAKAGAITVELEVVPIGAER